MKRPLHVTALLAMGLLVASSYAAGQDVPATTSGGKVTVAALGVEDISSSKFQEYREVPKGISIPFLNLFSTSSTLDVNLFGYNVRQSDQRYTGWLTTSMFGVTFDYNQTPHNMGNNGKTMYSELGHGRVGHELDAPPDARRDRRCAAADRYADGLVLRRAAGSDLRVDEQHRHLEPAPAWQRRGGLRRQLAASTWP